MCSMCGRVFCAPSCPNADEQEVFGRCDVCGDDILSGEEFVNIEGDKIHHACLTIADLLEMLDVAVEVAGDD